MRAPLTVATWNLLHRVHAENWAEDVPARHPDEAARIAAISARIAGLAAASGPALIGLQEVSGDQLASLRAALPAGARIYSLRYPRLPRPRAGAVHRATLADPSEHLVTVVVGELAAREVEAAAFDEDPGKGYVAVEIAGVLAINTHVSYDARRAPQLARLAALVRGRGGPSLLVGDFNAAREVVAAGLGGALAFARASAGAPPTRPRAGGGKPQDIDHVILSGAGAASAEVIDVAGLSDHNLVIATLADLAAG